MAKPKYRKTIVKPTKRKKPTKSSVYWKNRNSRTASGFVEYISTIAGAPNKVLKEYGINFWGWKRRGH